MHQQLEMKSIISQDSSRDLMPGIVHVIDEEDHNESTFLKGKEEMSFIEQELNYLLPCVQNQVEKTRESLADLAKTCNQILDEMNEGMGHLKLKLEGTRREDQTSAECKDLEIASRKHLQRDDDEKLQPLELLVSTVSARVHSIISKFQEYKQSCDLEVQVAQNSDLELQLRHQGEKSSSLALQENRVLAGKLKTLCQNVESAWGQDDLKIDETPELACLEAGKTNPIACVKLIKTCPWNVFMKYADSGQVQNLKVYWLKEKPNLGERVDDIHEKPPASVGSEVASEKIYLLHVEQKDADKENPTRGLPCLQNGKLVTQCCQKGMLAINKQVQHNDFQEATCQMALTSEYSSDMEDALACTEKRPDGALVRIGIDPDVSSLPVSTFCTQLYELCQKLSNLWEGAGTLKGISRQLEANDILAAAEGVSTNLKNSCSNTVQMQHGNLPSTQKRDSNYITSNNYFKEVTILSTGGTVESLKSKLNDLDGRNQKLQSELSKLKDWNLILQEMKSDLQEKNAALMTQHKQEMEVTKAAWQKQHRETTCFWQREVKHLQKTCEELLLQKDTLFARTKQEKDTLQMKYENAKKVVIRLENSIAGLTDEVALHKQSCEKATQEVHKLQDSLRKEHALTMVLRNQLHERQQIQRGQVFRMQSELQSQHHQNWMLESQLHLANAIIRDQEKKKCIPEPLEQSSSHMNDILPQRNASSSATGKVVLHQPVGSGCQFQCEDEEGEFMNHSHFYDPNVSDLCQDETSERIAELRRRNTLCPPHLRTIYPVEMQGWSKDMLNEETPSQGDVSGSERRAIPMRNKFPSHISLETPSPFTRRLNHLRSSFRTPKSIKKLFRLNVDHASKGKKK